MEVDCLEEQDLFSFFPSCSGDLPISFAIRLFVVVEQFGQVQLISNRNIHIHIHIHMRGYTRVPNPFFMSPKITKEISCLERTR